MTILTEAPLVAKQRGDGGEFMLIAERAPALIHGLKPVVRGWGWESGARAHPRVETHG